MSFNIYYIFNINNNILPLDAEEDKEYLLNILSNRNSYLFLKHFKAIFCLIQVSIFEFIDFVAASVSSFKPSFV
jgi:hypothetical protein